jgi:tRNA dimethylallyltransferase
MGPTATGKTALALEVAARLDGEIVSVDSRQAYRGMEIGTAAPSPEARARIPHHGVAFLAPRERYSAGRFARNARRWIRGIERRGHTPVLAGGTGFFLRALTDPVFEEPPMDPSRREALRTWCRSQPDGRLRRWVRRMDPALAERLDRLDPQRCARTLELALLAGRPLSWWHRNGEPEAPPLETLVVVLEAPADDLKRRIRERADRILGAGWRDEVRALREAGFDRGDRPFTALGYGEVAALVDGELDREEALEAIATATWQYARRQRTWFRHQVPEERTLRLDARRPVDELADRVETAWRRAREPAPTVAASETGGAKAGKGKA